MKEVLDDDLTKYLISRVTVCARHFCVTSAWNWIHFTVKLINWYLNRTLLSWIYRYWKWNG
jgi:hypothetical protein